MKHTFALLLVGGALAGLVTADASAQFRGLGNALKRGVEEATGSKPSPSNPASRGGAGGSASSGDLGVPDKSLTDLTQCAGLKLENVQVGVRGDYSFKQGFSNEKRRGFVNRRKGEVIRDCITPSLNPGEIVYFEVNKAQFERMGAGNAWQMQCVKSNNPGGGTVRLASWNGTTHDYLNGADIKLHCGNDQGIEDCASGTNSERGYAYRTEMNNKGKVGVSFMARFAEIDRDTGRLYCQFYNKKSGKSLVAFEMDHQRQR